MTKFIKVSPENMGAEQNIQEVWVNPTYIVSMTQFSEGTGITLMGSHIATRRPLHDILAQVDSVQTPNQPREAADGIPPAILQSWVEEDDEEE